MAKNFVYPVAQAVITDGVRDETVNGATTYDFNDAATPGDNVTDRERISDQSIGTAISDFGADDVLRFDLGSAFACDSIAIYMSTSTSNDIEVYTGSDDDGLDMDTSTTMPILTKASQATGWSVGAFTEATKRYWFVRSKDGDVDASEIFFGIKYDFPINFELNNTLGELSGADNITAWGGQEYSNKRHENKTTWNWNWKYMSAAHKAAMDTLNSTVGDHTKFIYDDETTKHWVKQAKLMKFTEVAPSVYSTSVSLREQLI